MTLLASTSDFHDLWVILRGGEDEDRAVRDAAVAFRAGCASGVAVGGAGGAGGFPGEPCLRLGPARRRPDRSIRYDNLKPAVSRVLFGRTRSSPTGGWRSARTTASPRSTASLATKAVARRAASRVRAARFRRNHCVPMPIVDSIDELNALHSGLTVMACAVGRCARSEVCSTRCLRRCHASHEFRQVPLEATAVGMRLKCPFCFWKTAPARAARRSARASSR